MVSWNFFIGLMEFLIEFFHQLFAYQVQSETNWNDKIRILGSLPKMVYQDQRLFLDFLFTLHRRNINKQNMIQTD